MEDEIDPKCLDSRQNAFGLTNRGELIPCCWADNQVNRKDPIYQKLKIISYIFDYYLIDDIIITNKLLEFTENLLKGKGMQVCHQVCKKRSSPQHKKEVFIDNDGKPRVKAT